jgi:hypothetical protein
MKAVRANPFHRIDAAYRVEERGGADRRDRMKTQGLAGVVKARSPLTTGRRWGDASNFIDVLKLVFTAFVYRAFTMNLAGRAAFGRRSLRRRQRRTCTAFFIVF